MLEFPGLKLDLDGNVFKIEASIPFIPPSKMQYKDKYKPFKGEVKVEKDRLLKFYEILDDALNGKFIEEIFFLNEDTQRLKAIALIPPSFLSGNVKKRGGVYGFFVSYGKIGVTEKVKTARAFLSFTLINLLRKLIKEKGKMAYSFNEIDKDGNIHSVIIERDKGKVKILYPVELDLPPTKHSKLQLSVNYYLDKMENVPTTIVNSQIVFRKNTNGDFAIHTPYHSVNIKEEDVRRLKFLIE